MVDKNACIYKFGGLGTTSFTLVSYHPQCSTDLPATKRESGDNKAQTPYGVSDVSPCGNSSPSYCSFSSSCPFFSPCACACAAPRYRSPTRCRCCSYSRRHPRPQRLPHRSLEADRLQRRRPASAWRWPKRVPGGGTQLGRGRLIELGWQVGAGARPMGWVRFRRRQPVWGPVPVECVVGRFPVVGLVPVRCVVS